MFLSVEVCIYSPYRYMSDSDEDCCGTHYKLYHPAHTLKIRQALEYTHCSELVQMSEKMAIRRGLRHI